MARNHNTNKNGGSWTEETKKAVWKKGRVIKDYSPEIWRYDICGSVMKYSEHGDRDSKHGWEIDHINPVANGGSDHIDNLQPLYWENNARKGDKLDWNCN